MKTLLLKIIGWFTGGATAWYILAIVLALGLAGTAGLYAGYDIAAGRFAADKADLMKAQADALEAKNAQLVAEQQRGNEIANKFLAALGDIHIENKTFNNQVRVEREKLVYTDCKLPDTGANLLDSHIDAANLKLLGVTK